MRTYADVELLERIRTSDHEAFDQLYQRYWKLLYTLATQKTGNAAEAEDIVQEIFIDLWKRRATLEITHSLKPYLVSAVYFRIFRFFRDRGVRERQIEDFARFIDQTVGSLDELYQSAAKLETTFGALQDIIWETIRQMPERMQKVALLRFKHGQTVPEIAAALQLSPLTVKKQLQLAMARLRQTAGTHVPDATALLLCLWILQSSY